MKDKSYTHDELVTAVSASRSYAETMRRLGLKGGGAQSSVKKTIAERQLDVGHFSGQKWASGESSYNRKTAEHFLVKNRKTNAAYLRRSLLEIGRTYLCEDCGNGQHWNGFQLTLEIDHKDRDVTNNEPSNLRFLCPNCHSQYGALVPVVVERNSCLDIPTGRGATFRP